MGILSNLSNWLIDYAGAYNHNGDSDVMTRVKAENAKQRINSGSSGGITGDVLKNILSAYQTSAIKAEKQATLDAQAFQKQQADIAWQRSESSAKKQMDFQREMWQKSADYNTEMSNTAYQRAVADLRKSGLNPILAVTNGSASAPTIAIPSGASSSAQAMSGYKADYSSAKNSDLKGVESILGIISSAFTSALKILR